MWKDLPFGGYRGNACPFGFPIPLTQDAPTYVCSTYSTLLSQYFTAEQRHTLCIIYTIFIQHDIILID